MDIELPRGEGCSACGACLAMCPVEAIQMEASAEGFLYPVIQEDKCVRCGKCANVCALRATEERHQPLEAYAAVGSNEDLVRNSASGGVFASLATQCVQQGGLVAGAVMDADGENIQVYHCLTDQLEGLGPMQGSKYVQSDAWKCYKELIKAVRQGKQVLFTGTPCQVSAVKRITGNPDNLVTMDLICHGVPSLQMLNDYVKILNRRFHGQTKQIIFRDKTVGKSFCARVDVLRGKKCKQLYLRSHHMSYYQFFLEGAVYRDSCYVCPYAGTERVSDITIGDYWGIEKYHSEAMTNRDADKKTDWSCLMVNTPKGKAFIEKVGQDLETYSSQVSYVAETNQQLNMPSKKPEKRAALLKLYREQGYTGIEKTFLRQSGGAVRYFWRTYKEMRRYRDSGKIN